MKTRLTILVALLVTATTLFAQERQPHERTTIVVRDGKLLDIDGQPLLGGKRAYLGVGSTDLTPQLREHFGASKDAGVLIGSVESGSPADKAGIKVGDLILTVDGKDIDSTSDLRHAMRDKKDGDTIRVDILRGHNRQTVVATLAEKEFELPTFLRGLDSNSLQQFNRRLGDLPPEFRTRVESIPNCIELQSRIKDLEARLKDLEKKLQK